MDGARRQFEARLLLLQVGDDQVMLLCVSLLACDLLLTVSEQHRRRLQLRDLAAERGKRLRGVGRDILLCGIELLLRLGDPSAQEGGVERRPLCLLALALLRRLRCGLGASERDGRFEELLLGKGIPAIAYE